MAHKFTFEIWPANATERTLPEHVSRWGRSPDETLAAVKADRQDNGQTIVLSGHVRSQCDPPHPGIDVAYVPGPEFDELFKCAHTPGITCAACPPKQS
jgi:hypothetical protein